MTKGSGVILLHRDKFDIYTTLSPNILEFKFVPDIVRDQDVVNKDLLHNIINMFIQSNKIEPADLTIVVADNATFVKDFPKDDKSPDGTIELEKKIDEFLEHIPFEHVTGKVMDLPTAKKVFASNLELIESLKFAFEKVGFNIDAAIPAALYGNNIGTLPALSLVAANYISQSTPQLKKYNFLLPDIRQHEKEEKEVEKTNSVADIPESENQEKQKPKTDKKRLILLGSVFGILFIILIVVYIMSNQHPKPTAQAQPVSTVQTIPNP